MEKETLFVAVKWEILKSLSKGKKSPLELSQETNSSVSNISQALRFLELSGLIKSERITNRDKGKPRVMYSIAEDTAYLIITTEGFTKKEQVKLTNRKKTLLKIWLFEHANLHRFIEKAYENIEQETPNYEGILLNKNTLPNIELNIIPKEGHYKKIKPITYDYNNITKEITYVENNWETINQNPEYYYAIHDPLLKYKQG